MAQRGGIRDRRFWGLAVMMRQFFGPWVDLRECVGLNGIFLRSPEVKQYRADVALRDRKRVNAFCHQHVLRIVDLLEPKAIVCIGFDALKLFYRSPPAVLHNEQGKALARAGSVGAHKAIAMFHLTRLLVDARYGSAGGCGLHHESPRP